MKVLHVAPMDRTIYRFRLGILNAARDMGYETHIWCKNTVQEHVDEMRELGHVVHEAQIERNIGIVNIGSAIRGLRKLLRSQKFDIIHTHTPIGGLVGRVAARLERVPNVFHTTGGWYFHEYMGEPKKSMYIKIEKALASITDVIFSVNYEDIGLAEKYGISPRREIVYSGPGGVDLDKFNIDSLEERKEQTQKKLGISEGHFVIGLISRIVWEKGFKELFDALVKVKEQSGIPFTFVHAGIGPNDKEVMELCEQSGLSENVIFLGYRTDVHELMTGFDMLLFPSHREGFGTSVLEAMSMQLPVVAFDIRGCREGIDDGVTGRLIPFGDTDLMASEVLRLMDDREERLRMGLAGRKRISEMFTKERHVELQLPSYEAVKNSIVEPTSANAKN